MHSARAIAKARDDTPVGSFGKYQLFASLGRGGMADVFLSVARGQMGFHKLAVVKRLRPALGQQPAFREMFLDEARLAARLNHPNIVHSYEVGEQDGLYFIAMEYLEGQSLNKVLKELVRRREPFGIELAVRVVADALAGLGHAHELRDYDGRPLSVVHRDVSPHNIFVTYDGHTKLVDFGIAKAALSSTETEVGVLKGKVAYMSPEQAKGEPLDPRSDLFAMGIVLWESVTLQSLLAADNPATVIHRLMSVPIPRASEAAPGLDPGLDQIIARSLEKDRSLRFQSAAEMRSALEAWLASRPIPARPEDVGRRIQALFSGAREEFQQQIQRQMSMLGTANDTAELAVLAVEPFERSPISTGPYAFADGGSGTVIVATRDAERPGLVGPASAPGRAPDVRSTNLLVLVGAMSACFCFAALLLAYFGFAHRVSPSLADVDPGASSTLAISAPVTPSSAASEAMTSAPAASTPPATPVTSSSSSPPQAPAAKHSRVAAPKASAGPATPPQAEDPGALTVVAYPWAKVTEGSKVICAVTPCFKVPMSPGAHTLTFEAGDPPGQKQVVTVQIRSGETASKNVGFK
jgi:serine/threonine-protein kinase